MSNDVIIGLDAGTSVIKAVAFTIDGAQLGSTSRPNRYQTLANGGVEQDMARTWADAVAVLADLVKKIDGLASRAIALSVTGQGDGTWLIDADGEPVHDGWLWLDARAKDDARRLAASSGAQTIYEQTGSGITVCQMRVHLNWLRRERSDLLEKATTAFHCKDWLYFKLTDIRATDPTEGVFTFGNYRTRDYSDTAIEALGLGDLKRLLPPIVDGARHADPLTASAANATGLPQGLPVCLGYVDVMCSALGAGLHDETARPGLTVLGSTGVHMRFAANAGEVVLNDERSGYTMAFPGDALAQMQTNMAATLNIDWALDLAVELLEAEGVTRQRSDLLRGLDDRVLAARSGVALFHPYISAAGERGPFAEPDARASLTGLDQSVGWFELVRSVFDGLALAARDCYSAMGPTPSEIRLTGGAARSKALRYILAASLKAPVRTVAQLESGAAGAAMIAAVQQGVFPNVAKAADAWVTPLLQTAEQPDAALARHYDEVYHAYASTRRAMPPIWAALADMRSAAS